jgi:hypothetical protein
LENGMKETAPLGSVRPGDVLSLQQIHFRVLSSQRHAGVMTLELEDTAEHSMTLVGIPGMPVTIESRYDRRALGPVNPDVPTDSDFR